MGVDSQSQGDVPAAVLHGLREFRAASGPDLPEFKGVLRWLRDAGHYTAADWVERNPDKYVDVIGNFEGGG